MPIQSIEFWHNVGTTRGLLAPMNGSGIPDFYNLAWHGTDGIFPSDWMQPEFDDSGWSDTTLSPSTFTSVRNGLPLGYSLATELDYHGPARPEDDAIIGVWPRFNPSQSWDLALLRNWITLPDFGRVTNFEPWGWASQGRILATLESHNIPIRFSAPNTGHNLSESRIYINGNQWGGGQQVLDWLIPGQPNLIAWMIVPPLPANISTGNIITDLAGGETANFWSFTSWAGFAYRMSFTSTYVMPPNIEGERSHVSPGLLGLPIPGTYYGPFEVRGNIGWDSGQNANTFLATGLAPWSASGSGGYVPPGGGSNGLPLAPIEPFTDAIIRQSIETFVAIAQGFAGRWTPIEWIRANMWGNIQSPTTAWPVNDVLVCEVCVDDNGVPGAVIGTSIVPMSELLTLGPVYFHFDPPVVIDTGMDGEILTYWVKIHAADPNFLDSYKSYIGSVVVRDPITFEVIRIDYFPSITVDTLAWEGNRALSEDADPRISPVTFGHPEQGYQSLQLYQNTGTGTYQWISNALSLVPPAFNYHGTVIPAIRDTASVFDIAIGADSGIAFLVQGVTYSSLPNGMGTAGRRDPNSDIWPVGSNVTGWNIEYTQINYIYPLVFRPQPYNELIDVTGVPLGAFVDDLGLLWKIVGYSGFNGSDGPHAVPGTWGPILATQLNSQNVVWPWEGGMAIDPNFFFRPSMAVRRANGSMVAFTPGLSEPFDLSTGPTSGTYARVSYQELSGHLPGSTFGEVNQIGGRERADYTFLSAVLDSEDYIHVFVTSGGGSQLVEYHYPVEGGFNIIRIFTQVTNLYHAVLSPEGVLGPLRSVDCVTNNNLPLGTGCIHPNGGIAIPYTNVNGDFLVAIFPTGSDDITPIRYEELPTLSYESQDPNIERVVPVNRWAWTSSFTLLSCGTLVSVGDTMYLFAQDTFGVSVARWRGGSWSGLLPWADDLPGAPGTQIQFGYEPYHWSNGEGGLTAAYLPTRGQIGVAWIGGGHIVFRWFTDPGTWPAFTPLRSLVTSPCTVGGGSFQLFSQVIG